MNTVVSKKIWTNHTNDVRGIQGVNRSCFMGSIICSLAYIPCFSQTLLTHQAFQFISEPENMPLSLLVQLKQYFGLLLQNTVTSSKNPFQSRVMNKKYCIRTDYLYNNKVCLMGFEDELYDVIDFLIKLFDKICEESRTFKLLIKSVFGFNWDYNAYCINGHHTSSVLHLQDNISFDYNIIRIPVDNNNANSSRCMRELIKNHFGRRKYYHGRNEDCLKCPHDNRNTVDQYENKIHSYPEVMVVQFSAYPLQSYHIALELKLALIVEVSSEIYQLCSFISFSPGHYMCYVRGTDTSWYNINDDVVTKIATKDILKLKEVYVCFYQKTTTPFSDAQISNLREIQGCSKNGEIMVTLPFSINPVDRSDLNFLYKCYMKFNNNLTTIDIPEFQNMFPRLELVLCRKVPENFREKLQKYYGNPSNAFEISPTSTKDCILYHTVHDSQMGLGAVKSSYVHRFQTIMQVLNDKKKHVLIIDNEKYLLPEMKNTFQDILEDYIAKIKDIIYYDYYYVEDNDQKYQYQTYNIVKDVKDNSLSATGASLSISSLNSNLLLDPPSSIISSTTSLQSNVLDSIPSTENNRTHPTTSMETDTVQDFTADEYANSQLSVKRIDFSKENNEVLDLTGQNQSNNTNITTETLNLEQENTNDDVNMFKDWNDVLSMFQDCLKENKAISLTPEQIQRLMNVAPSTSKGKEIDLTEVNDN